MDDNLDEKGEPRCRAGSRTLKRVGRRLCLLQLVVAVTAGCSESASQPRGESRDETTSTQSRPVIAAAEIPYGRRCPPGDKFDGGSLYPLVDYLTSPRDWYRIDSPALLDVGSSGVIDGFEVKRLQFPDAEPVGSIHSAPTSAVATPAMIAAITGLLTDDRPVFIGVDHDAWVDIAFVVDATALVDLLVPCEAFEIWNEPLDDYIATTATTTDAIADLMLDIVAQPEAPSERATGLQEFLLENGHRI